MHFVCMFLMSVSVSIEAGLAQTNERRKEKKTSTFVLSQRRKDSWKIARIKVTGVAYVTAAAARGRVGDWIPPGG